VTDAGTGDAVRDLLDDALECYGGEPEVTAILRARRERLDGPLRVALVGRVKAGKSTLLNALAGERLAPTDAGECTRVLTEYRHGSIPRVTLHGRDGRSRALPVRRDDGELRLDLAGTAPDEVDRLIVDWPSAPLHGLTLVDTPGTASLTGSAGERTTGFVGGADGAGPDGLVFLTRRVQPEDLAVLTAFGTASGSALPTTTLVVLSRADEVGSGQLEAMLAARELALRTEEEPAVRALGTPVVPVAGLVGLAGRLLRHRDFVALRSLALAPRAPVEDMLLTADRFLGVEAPVPLSASMRTALLDELGLFGIRLAITLLRGSIATPDALSDELVRRSGLRELERLVDVHFRRRSDVMRAAGAVRTVEQVLRRAPVPGDGRLWAHLERVRLASHDLAELDLLAGLRAVDGPLPRGLQAEATRLLGGEGTGVAERLGLPADAAEDEQRTAGLTAVLAWRDRADDPLARRATVDACEVVARSVEGLLARLERAAGNPYGLSAGEPSPAGTSGAGGGSAGAGAQPGA
jgi:Dynamin family